MNSNDDNTPVTGTIRLGGTEVPATYYNTATIYGNATIHTTAIVGDGSEHSREVGRRVLKAVTAAGRLRNQRDKQQGRWDRLVNGPLHL